MRCAIYSRVSTTKQENDNQLAQLGEFTRAMNWAVVAEYVDQITGKSSDRPEFQKMFQDASQRKFDLLLFAASCSVAGNFSISAFAFLFSSIGKAP